MTSKPITKSFNSPEKLSFNPHISETDIVQSRIHQDPKENPMNYPSFSQYINPQRLKPYDEMLKKNIRSFNIIPKGDKKFEENTPAAEVAAKKEDEMSTPIVHISYNCLNYNNLQILDIFQQSFSILFPK